jgi:hypothetical protein
MSIIIEGPAFPLDEINANKWGVPASEANNAIESLKNSVIRVCTRADPHICDLFEDPYAEIGRITDAWEQAGSIFARGIITDSVAEQKITEGTWGNSWSVFAYEESNTDGFSQGFQARSMTLVQNPAWETANWAIVAARDKGAKHRKPVSSASNVFTISDSTKTKTKKSSCKRKGDSMADNPNPEIQELLTRLEALEKATIQPGQSEITDAVTASLIKEVSASIKTVENDLKEKEARIATLEKELSTAIPAEKFPEMLAAALKEGKEIEKRAAAYERFAAVRQERGLESKEEDYRAMTAADFERSISELENLRPVQAGAQYPRGGSGESAGANTGTYDPYTRTWKGAK